MLSILLSMKHGISVQLFADDVKLYLKILNVIDTAQLQGALSDLVQWADRWQLSLSVDKCCVLNIGILQFDTTLCLKKKPDPYYVLK